MGNRATSRFRMDLLSMVCGETRKVWIKPCFSFWKLGQTHLVLPVLQYAEDELVGEEHQHAEDEEVGRPKMHLGIFRAQAHFGFLLM